MSPGAAATSGAGRAPLGYVAFDPGTRRLGVATGNSITGQATALTTLTQQGDARWRAITDLLAHWSPDVLVVGVPFHPDGAEHEGTQRARAFARQLRGRYPRYRLAVQEVDERYSSVEAQRTLGPRSQAKALDAAAASVILQQHLDALSRDNAPSTLPQHTP